MAKQSLEQAYRDEKKGDYNNAIRDFTEAIKLKPDEAALYKSRAHAYQHLKQYEKAIADFTAAIRLEPGNVSNYNDRSIVFDALGDKARAEQDQKKAEELRSNGHASTLSPTPVPAPTTSPNARKVASPTEVAQSQGAAPFDGTWKVSVVSPDNRDATGMVARCYRLQFAAHVKNGILHGEQGSQGRPSSLVIDGKIQPDGSADLSVRGVTGDAKYNLGHTNSGTPYNYEVKAHFDGSRGTGTRLGGRISNYTFVRSPFLLGK